MVYILFFGGLIAGALVVSGRVVGKMLLSVIMLFLLAIIGFRDVSVGTDTLSYTEDFMRFSNMAPSEMWKYAISTKEPLYIIVSWLPSIFTRNYTIFLLAWALFPVCSLYSVFKNELQGSKDYMIAFFVFFLLGLFAFFVAGIRQTAALSIVFYAGSKYLSHIDNHVKIKSFIWNKTLYRFLILIGIAYLFHNSSVLFLLAIPFLFVKVRWWYLILAIGFFFLGKYVHVDILVTVSKFFFEDRFENYGTAIESSVNTSGFIMQIILFLICFSVKGKLIKDNYQNNFLFNMMFLGLVFQSLSGLIAEMFRISFYFSMFGMILVPRAFKAYSINYRSIAYLGFTLVSLLYLLFLTSSNLPEYHSVL